MNILSKMLIVLLSILSIDAKIHGMSRLNQGAQHIITTKLCRHMSTAQAADLLQVTADAPNNLVKEQYKKLAKIHHPDVGGSPATFAKTKEAYEALLKSRDPFNIDYIDAREEYERAQGCTYPCSYWNAEEQEKFATYLHRSSCLNTLQSSKTGFYNPSAEGIQGMVYEACHKRVKARILKERKETENIKSLLKLDGVSSPAIIITTKGNYAHQSLSSILTEKLGQHPYIDYLKKIEDTIWQVKIWYKIQKIYPEISPKTHYYDLHGDYDESLNQSTLRIAFYKKS